MEDFLLTRKEKAELKEVHKVMADFHSVMLALQRSDLTMGQVCTLFDGIIEKYPTMTHYIASNAKIVHSASFESALVKLEEGISLTKEEEAVTSSLLVWIFFFHC